MFGGDCQGCTSQYFLIYPSDFIISSLQSKEKRLKDFAGFIVDKQMIEKASNDVIFLHCLPAYRGYEVSADVIDSEQSLVFQEAENRLHAQKGIMVWLSNQEENKI